jgi:hypothetical protein
MNDLRDLLEQASDQWGSDTVQAILKELRKYPVKWEGTLDRSIIYELDSSGNVDIFMADYGQFQDQGVDGTQVKRNSPFSFKGKIAGTAKAIKKWADAKGLNNWAVATTVQRKGIKPRPFFNSVITNRIPDLAAAIQQAQIDYINKQVDKL